MAVLERPVARAVALALALTSTQCVRPHGPPAPRAPDEPVVAFVDVTVLPLDTTARLAAQTVIVRGDRIAQLGPRGAVAVPAGARVIDGHGRYLIPGLMDMHVHLARREDLSLLLGFGITTVRNMWGAPVHLDWRDRIARGELQGPTLVTAGPIVDGEPPAHPGSLIVRSEADADRAIALHRRLGYDFVKVYSRLAPAPFERLVAGARGAGLAVAGHVPWAVPLDHAVDAGMTSIEHLSGFVAALQAADSPLAGRVDGPSRARQIDHVDEGRLAGLVRTIAAHHTFDVPTRGVMDSWASAAEVRAALARPEARWLAPWQRAIAEPGPDDADELDRSRRQLALYDRILRALDQAGAPIATGTDPGNPLVIPGVALHHELELLVGAGLSPLAALQAATRRGAELLGRQGEIGRVAVGMRADLVLLDGDPLDDIHSTRRIAGVMARGRYADRRALDALLAQAAAGLAGRDWFAGAPAPSVDGEPVFRADYDITWRDAAFGGERVTVGRRGDALDVWLEAFDANLGETTRARWQSATGTLAVDRDGAIGRGHLAVERGGGQLHARGTALPGVETALDRAIPADAVIAPDDALSAVVLWRAQLAVLAVGQSTELREAAIGLASEAEASERVVTALRVADRTWDSGRAAIPARVYRLAPARGGAAELVVDADGWPLELVRADHGAVLRLRRRMP